MALAFFLAAFLLFQIQPILGRYVLPWFGGGPGVWIACLLFFQAGLLAGYGYAHGLTTWLPARAQAALHAALVAASLLLLPAVPSRPLLQGDPTRQVLQLLVTSAGLPYLLLASTSPLLQRWSGVPSPYRYYAISNAGAFLALLSYPVAVEPFLTLGRQSQVWSWLYVGFAALTGFAALRRRAAGDPAASSGAPGPAVQIYWLALSACGSALLLATTNQMCQEVASTPFLWILPLALYLLTFILVFRDDRWYPRRWFGLAVGLTVMAACTVMGVGLRAPLWAHVLSYSLALFACCMACHGELARARPDPAHLTRFYLIVAGGGALGSALFAFAAPRVFLDFGEFYVALAATCLLVMAGWYRERAWSLDSDRPQRLLVPLAGLLTGFLVALLSLFYSTDRTALARSRNFYGVLRVTESMDSNGPKRTLTHGRTTHGLQYVDAFKRDWPTSYYGRESGIGLAIEQLRNRRSPLRIGVIGLGVGTLAAYGRPGDVIRFYEINPDVIRFARQYFTYLDESAAQVEVVLGDARIQLEQEAAGGRLGRFDILAVDAFSSDAIPTHLLTLECAKLYREHLKPDGLLLLHISNRSVDLSPVALGLAQQLGWTAVKIESGENDRAGTHRATWVLLGPDAASFQGAELRGPARVWTDDFAGLWPVLRF